jgi:hypothetical protein
MGKPPGRKLIRVTAEVEGGVIRAISIRGDFFASPVEGFDRAERRLRGVPVNELGSRFDRYLREEGVEAQGIDGEGLERVIATTDLTDSTDSFTD